MYPGNNLHPRQVHLRYVRSSSLRLESQELRTERIDQRYAVDGVGDPEDRGASETRSSWPIRPPRRPMDTGLYLGARTARHPVRLPEQREITCPSVI